MTGLPLDGVRVVSFSTAFAGPTTSRYLADYGAEVIKVESLRRSDNTRNSPDSRREPSGVATSPQFQHFNRNKRDIAIDLSQERGRELMRALVQRTDVVTENFSGRVMNNWGMDYQSLRQVRPDIIVLDMQGMGQTGPWKDFISFGNNLHSYAALTSIWGYSHSSIADYMSAQHAVFAVLAALLRRNLTGAGTHIEFGQVEVIPAMLGTFMLDYFANGTVTRDVGNHSPIYAPHGCYACQGADEWCVVAVTSDAEWQRLCTVIDRPDWLADARLAAGPGRVRHSANLDAGVQAWTRQRRAHDVEEVLQAAGVPAAAVRTRAEMDHDAHLRARGFITSIEHPVLGEREHVGLSINFSESAGRTAGHAPLLGQDNEYVFGELLGLTTREIDDLAAQGVLT
ncbi:MAG: CoA transferase [Chloroflexi bacterium]|nr:CoA transferase [Chloroflexota bacterium]